jgi:acetyl esterase/lipase
MREYEMFNPGIGLLTVVLWVLMLPAKTLNAATAQNIPAQQNIAVPLVDAKTPTHQAVGVWQAPAGLQQIPIWPGSAPDMAGITQAPESVFSKYTPQAIEGEVSQAVFDVSSPTMTVFPPKGKNTGAAIVVFPGGGYAAVVVTLEGTEICNWITSRGITCVLSKYRVPGTNHYWNKDCKCHITPDVPRALQDAQRTIRLVRAKAQALQIDPQKIGVMGFSAGGYLVAQTSNIFQPVYAAVDAMDQISSRPDFSILFFPGHLCRSGNRLDPSIQPSKNTPPTFLLQAWDDPVDRICNSTLYARALDEAGVGAEVHLFAKGGHAFGLRRNQSPDKVWPSLVENWLRDIGVLR